MKKWIILPIITMMAMPLISLDQSAEAKNHRKIKHIKHIKYVTPRVVNYRYTAPRRISYVAPRYIAPRRINYLAPRVYVTPRYYVPRPKVIIPATSYRTPLVSYRPGLYYFNGQSPAYVSRNTAYARGYKSSYVSFYNNRWVLNIR